jgi:hypothetical protein
LRLHPTMALRPPSLVPVTFETQRRQVFENVVRRVSIDVMNLKRCHYRWSATLSAPMAIALLRSASLALVVASATRSLGWLSVSGTSAMRAGSRCVVAMIGTEAMRCHAVVFGYLLPLKLCP